MMNAKQQERNVNVAVVAAVIAGVAVVADDASPLVLSYSM